MILLILILLDNDIAENPGPFSDEISIFHVIARSVRKKLDYIESPKETEGTFSSRKNLSYSKSTRRFTFKFVDTYTSTPPPKQFLSFLKGLS
jgi:hypothetical protein